MNKEDNIDKLNDLFDENTDNIGEVDTEKEHQSNIDKNDDPKINNASVHNQKLDINSNVGSFVNVEEPIADGINDVGILYLWKMWQNTGDKGWSESSDLSGLFLRI